MAKQISEAKELIDSLLARGVKKSEIAKKLGIDSSTISQIEKGKKPGRNLIEPLRAIAQKRATIPPREIRKTKSGEVAKVRKSKKVSAPALKRDKLGRIKIAPVTSLPYVAERRLKELAEAGAKVSIRLRFGDGTEKVLFARGGEFASRLLKSFLNSGQKFFDWLSDEASDQLGRQSYGDIDFSDDIEGVGYLAIYTAAGGEA